MVEVIRSFPDAETLADPVADSSSLEQYVLETPSVTVT